MDFGGIIAGAIGGAAKGYGDYAEGEMKNQQKLDLEKALSDVLVDRDARIRENSNKATLALEDQQMDPARAEKKAAFATAGKKAELTGALSSGLPALQAKVEGEAFEAGAATRAAKKAEELGFEERAARLKAKIESDINNDPTYLAGRKKLAQATHVENAGSLAQAALAQFTLGQQKELAGWRAALADSNNPDDREVIQQRINDLTQANSKSFSDVIGGANILMKEADKLRESAKMMDPNTSEYRDAVAKADKFSKTASDMVEQVNTKRTNAVPSASAPVAITPPAAAVEQLRKNPGTADMFDKTFGPGAAKRALEGGAVSNKPGLLSNAMPEVENIESLIADAERGGDRGKEWLRSIDPSTLTHQNNWRKRAYEVLGRMNARQ